MVFRYVDLLVGNSYLVDFVDTILRDERISLNDPIVMSFMEIYLPKVKHINTTIHSVENNT